MRWFPFRKANGSRKAVRRSAAQSTRARRRDNGAPRSPRPTAASSGHHWCLGIAFVVVWLCSSLSITFRSSPSTIHYVVGEIPDRNVYSELSFQYEDPAATRRLREQAMTATPPVYRIGKEEMLASLDAFDAAGESLRTGLTAPATETPPRIGDPPGDSRYPASAPRQALPPDLDPETLRPLLDIATTAELWQALHDLLKDTVNAGIADPDDLAALHLSAGATSTLYLLNDNRKSLLRIDELNTPQSAAAAIAHTFTSRFAGAPEGSAQALQNLLQRLLRPNMTFTAEATQAARQAAAATVRPVLHFVGANDLLLRRGHRVTEHDLVRLHNHQQELHSQSRLHRNPLRQFLVPVLCALLLLAAGRALHTVKHDAYREQGIIVLLALTAVIQILLARTVSSLYILNTGSSFFLFSMLPLSFAAMLLSPLVGLRIALCVAGYTSLIAALQTDTPHAFQLFLLGVLSSFMAGALMRHARKRSHVLLTGLGVGATVFLVQLVFVLQGNIPLDTATHVIPAMLGYAFVNGLAVAMVVSFLLPIFEYAFGLTTTISLVELSDLSHPLLKRLQLEAPGTYYHSLMVATLAERAATAIGANALLARVCAYFHDIGKLAHPEYFTENSQGGSPHESLQPRMSSLVILNHVKEGMELAQAAKLKKPLRAAIAEHHGTNLVYYFYHRAKNRSDADSKSPTVGEHDYRYPGPRPRSRETALISIADACEAAVRAMDKPTPGKIQTLVDDIIYKRIRDHQFDEANMTFAELAKARDAMVRTLGMMHHGRVQYPKDTEDETDLLKATERSAARKQEPAPEAAQDSHEPDRTQ